MRQQDPEPSSPQETPQQHPDLDLIIQEVPEVITPAPQHPPPFPFPTANPVAEEPPETSH